MTRSSTAARWSARLIAALAATGLACGAALAQPRQAVKIGYYPGALMSSLILLSDARGFYRQEGLDATLIGVASGPLVNSNIASGAIDVGLNAPSNIGLARDQGLDQTFIVGNLLMPWVLVARSGVKTPNLGKYPDVIRDLKGLSWGSFGRGSDGEMFQRVMAREAGLDVDRDVTWIGVGGPATGLPALKAERLDVYIAVDPAPLVLTSQGYGKILLDLRKGEGPANLKGVFYQGVVGKRSLMEERPEMVKALVRAHERAYCWVKDEKNFDELLAFLKDKIPVGELSSDQFRQLVKEGLTLFNLTFPERDVTSWNDMLVPAKVIKAPMTVKELVHPSVPQSNPGCA